MPKENNKMQVDIDTLKKQNVNDLLSKKELYSKIKEVEEKITQIKYIDNTLVKKIKKEYESLKETILDENILIKLTNDIEAINKKLNNLGNLGGGNTTGDAELINSIRSQLSNIEDTIAQINVIHSDSLPVINKWRKIKIDGRNGSESNSDFHRSTIKYTFSAGETVISSNLTNTEYNWFVYQYNSDGIFEKILINTKKVFSFIVEEGKKYAFQLWYGGSDFSKISSAQISVTNSIKNKVNNIENMYHNQFDYLTIDWVSGKANTGNGAFQESNTSIRSDYISIPHNEEVTLVKYESWNWFVNTYDKETLKF